VIPVTFAIGYKSRTTSASLRDSIYRHAAGVPVGYLVDMVKAEKPLIDMGETYYAGDLFDKSWYCTRHGCYPRRKVDDKCVVCAWEEQEAARIERLWSNLAKDLWERAKRRWKKDHFKFRNSEEWTLKVEDVEKIIPADRRCPILGIPLLVAGGSEPVFQRTKPYPIWSWRLRALGLGQLTCTR
jgi:hypothetical protein